MGQKPKIETSPLLRRMRDAIDGLAPKEGRLCVSVAREATWEKSDPNSDEVRVRWLCWSIEDGGEEIFAPEFEVLSSDVTVEQLSEELAGFFPDVEVVVDDNIEV